MATYSVAVTGPAAAASSGMTGGSSSGADLTAAVATLVALALFARIS